MLVILPSTKSSGFFKNGKRLYDDIYNAFSLHVFLDFRDFVLLNSQPRGKVPSKVATHQRTDRVCPGPRTASLQPDALPLSHRPSYVHYHWTTAPPTSTTTEPPPLLRPLPLNHRTSYIHHSNAFDQWTNTNTKGFIYVIQLPGSAWRAFWASQSPEGSTAWNWRSWPCCRAHTAGTRTCRTTQTLKNTATKTEIAEWDSHQAAHSKEEIVYQENISFTIEYIYFVFKVSSTPKYEKNNIWRVNGAAASLCHVVSS